MTGDPLEGATMNREIVQPKRITGSQLLFSDNEVCRFEIVRCGNRLVPAFLNRLAGAG